MIISNMPAEEYHADPCAVPSLSSSIAHILYTQSPYHAWVAHPKLNPDYQSESNSRADLGTIAHRILLEGNESNIVGVDADDWRTKDAKEQRNQAWSEGKDPILMPKLRQVREMVSVARDAIAKSEIAEAFEDAKSEQTILWNEEDTHFRVRLDRLANDHDIIFDYKTTENAHPESFIRGPMRSLGYDMKASLYQRGLRVATGKDCVFVWIVQEVNPPYAVSIVGMGHTLQEVAERKLAWTISKWRECMKTNCWPAYPSRICWAEAQSWQLSQIEERELQDE